MSVPVSPAVINGVIQLVDLATKIYAQSESGEITEEQALEALSVAQLGVRDAFDRFRDAPDGSDSPAA